MPAAPATPSHPDAEEVTLRDADISNLGRGGHGGRSGATQEDEDDEDDGRGGQRVQVIVALFNFLHCWSPDFAFCCCSAPNNDRVSGLNELSPKFPASWIVREALDGPNTSSGFVVGLVIRDILDVEAKLHHIHYPQRNCAAFVRRS